MRNFQIYITIISYVWPLHYICIKYRVLCLWHSIVWDIPFWGVSQSMMGNHDTPWLVYSSARQLSFHLGRVTPSAFTHSDLSDPFVSLPNTWVLRHLPIGSDFCVTQTDVRICCIGQKECQKCQLGQLHGWDRTTCLTLGEFCWCTKQRHALKA